MLPRLHTGGGRSYTATSVQKRHITGTTTSKRNYTGVARAQPVQPSCRLVLQPTGNGSSDHIGDKVPLPPSIPLDIGVYEVGRSSPADIRIDVPTVSSRHALLRVEDNKLCITDLNSTNGTVVNGHELSPMDNIEVEVGAEVIFGDMYLAKFKLVEEPDTRAAAADSTSAAAGGSGSSAAASSHTRAVHPNNTVSSS